MFSLFYPHDPKMFCRYFVVCSAIPQVIKVNCIDCIYVYTELMCLCICFFHFFLYKKKKTNYADPVSVCVLLYVIILIQVLIRYNVKNLITACTRSLDFDLKIEKSPYPGTPPSQTLPPLGRFARSHRSVAFVTFPLGAHQYVDPRYATAFVGTVEPRYKEVGYNKTLL